MDEVRQWHEVDFVVPYNELNSTPIMNGIPQLHQVFLQLKTTSIQLQQ
jgi:hypothetical protein